MKHKTITNHLLFECDDDLEAKCQSETMQRKHGERHYQLQEKISTKGMLTVVNEGKEFVDPREFCLQLADTLINVKLGKELIKSNVMTFFDYAMSRVLSYVCVRIKQRRTNDQLVADVDKCLTTALEIFDEMNSKCIEKEEDENLEEKCNNHMVAHFINSEPPEIHFFSVSSQNGTTFLKTLTNLLSKKLTTNKNGKYSIESSNSLLLTSGNRIKNNDQINNVTMKMELLKKNVHQCANNKRTAKVIASVLFYEDTGDDKMSGSKKQALLISSDRAKELTECLACLLQKFLVNQDLLAVYYTLGAFFTFFDYLNNK